MVEADIESEFVYNPRFLIPYHTGIAATDQTATAGRVLLLLFENFSRINIDSLIIINGTVIAGNVIVGVYGPIVTEDTCLGAPVLVQSASTPIVGANGPQIVPITETTLPRGRFYMAVEYSSATHQYRRQTNASQIIGWGQFYDRAGGFGALTDPCPAATDTGSALPALRVRKI